MLIQSLIEGGRSFTKTLRYDIPEEATIAAANLKDVGAEGVAALSDQSLGSSPAVVALGA